MEQYPISQAAKMVNMTSETLRHYDRIGLVKPGRKDEWTGYRYYTREDMVRLSTVQALSVMGLSLKEIKKVLEYDDLEKIVAFMEEAEKKADEKIRQLKNSKRKIRLARDDYREKLIGRQDEKTIQDPTESAPAGILFPTESIYKREIPERVILLSETLESPTLENLWDYQRHFFGQIDSSMKEEFDFEDLAGIYTDKSGSRLFATCIRYGYAEGMKTLPSGTYLCADCTEENRIDVVKNLTERAVKEYGVSPKFSLQMIVVSGILQWDYQIQICLGEL